MICQSLNKKTVSIKYLFVLLIMMFCCETLRSQDEICKIEVSAIEFKSESAYSISPEFGFENREHFDTLIVCNEKLQYVSERITKLKEKRTIVNTRVRCKIYYLDGSEKILAFGKKKNIYFDGITYKSDRKLIRLIKTYLPKYIFK